MEHLTVNNIIHTNQFGFQKIKSTYMPIIILQDIITQAFEEGEYTLGLFLDIKKHLIQWIIIYFYKNFTGTE